MLFHGGFGLPVVETRYWGGLMLTLIVATTGIVASLPIGILLALGRRSRLPIIRALSIAFIEFVRGVPLITILFMASVVLPALPAGGHELRQAAAGNLIGIALFSAAYLAEVVRGGLQAIPKGQYEGAMALGLNYWKMNALIILPQALRRSIPGIVNSFIGLFMDTTLVLIIGLLELLGTGAGLGPRSALAGHGAYRACLRLRRLFRLLLRHVALQPVPRAQARQGLQALIREPLP